MSAAPNMPPCTRTDDNQAEMIPCAYCRGLFAPKAPGQRFCLPKHRAAYAREIGIVGSLVISRRLKRRIRVALDIDDEAVLAAPLGTRFRLVREP